ncbi:MAG: STAS/SEC14 domain-containing protein [Bacteroidales bacterium]|nr:STAS/SEC14 domain-containing protein [Bacteroidales bacterium]
MEKGCFIGFILSMVGNYSYYYDAESGIMYKSYFGEITVEDIESSWEAAIEQNLIPEHTKKYIIDYRKAILKVKSTEHSAISDFYKKYPSTFKDARIAVISDSPRNTVIAILVHEKDEGFQSFPFDDLKEALEWISG